MKISVLCSSRNHPIYGWLSEWCERQKPVHKVELVSMMEDLSGGDILFLISCVQFVPSSVRTQYAHSLVIHASDLSEGRGWSPLVWQILEGRNKIVVSLIEAADSIDCGPVWHKTTMIFEGHELVDEINARLFKAELELMDYAVANCKNVTPVLQNNDIASYYEKREPEDSRVDPRKPLTEQFDLLRISDPQRYPAFFEYRGYEYEITLRKRRKIQK